MSAEPPSNGKSTPLPFTLTVWATPRSRRMSPPATRVQSAAGSNAGLVAGSWAVRPHSSTRLRSPDAEQGPVAPAERADVRADGVGADEREVLRVAGEARRERRGVGLEQEAGIVGGSLDADRGEDRVGFGLDELERVVGLARSGEHGLDLVAGRPLGGRPEVGDRDDGDVGEGNVGRCRRGRGLDRTRPATAAGGSDCSGRLRRLADPCGRARAGTRAGSRRARGEADGDHDGGREQAEDGDEGESFHGGQVCQ